MSQGRVSSVRALFPRSVKQVCEDVDAEIEHYMSLKQDELRQSGNEPDEALRLAYQAFGDAAKIRTELISIGLAPWRRLALVAGVVVILLITVLVSAVMKTRLEAGELDRVNRMLESRVRGQEQAIAAMSEPDSLRPAQTLRTVRVHGAIRDPRRWSFRRETVVTLSELIHKSGGLLENATGRVIVVEEQGGLDQPLIIELGDVLSGKLADPSLARSCTVVVESSTGPSSAINQ
ncbi:MAG: permease prefix domain 1-containing protein [Phycisphaerales bacterium]